MVIIYNKHDNIVMEFCNSVSLKSNGYIYSEDSKTAYSNDSFAYAETSEVIDFEYGKYLFVENEIHIVESTNGYGITDEIYNQILDDYTNELIESGVL